MEFAVFNPNEVDVATLPVIYGFNNGGPERFLMGVLVAEDGSVLGSHCCLSEHFMYGDLGILKGSAPSRHENFRKHYPNGYRMEFVPTDKMESHEAFNRVIAITVKQQAELAELNRTALAKVE